MKRSSGSAKARPEAAPAETQREARDRAVRETAARVRSAFVACLRALWWQVYASETSWGAGHLAKWDDRTKGGMTVWEKIADRCLSERMDPVHFVQALFAERGPAMVDNGRKPLPNMCLSQAASETYRKYVASLAPSFRDALAAQSTQLAVETSFRQDDDLDYDAAMRSALCDSMLPLSGLFRHCMAAARGYADIAERFADPALSQYAYNASAYDEVWGEFIPDGLREAAKRKLGRRRDG